MGGIVRNSLLAIQVAHLSRWWETSDVLVGLMGVITSIMDIAPVWPKQQTTPKFAVAPSKAESRREQLTLQEDDALKRKDSVGSQASTLAPLDTLSAKSST